MGVIANGFSIWHLAIVLMIALLVFGPSKLPDLGKAVGQSIREFRNSTRELTDEAMEAKKDVTKAAKQE